MSRRRTPVPDDELQHRRPRTGSIYRRTDSTKWWGAYTNFERRRVTFCRETREEVEAELSARVTLQRRPRTKDRLFFHTRRARAESWIRFLLEEADREEWDDAYTAQVIVAQLSPRRIRLDIFGPCDYCGTWVAGTIDHVIATSRGGTNDRENLVSACFGCNSRKGPRPVESLRFHPRLLTGSATGISSDVA